LGLASIIFCLPLFVNWGFWGINDWDYYLFNYAVARKTLLNHLQFPLWNPYYCGGNPLLANPQSFFLSPFFLVLLFFGELLGVKLLVLLHMFVGMAGAYFLGRQYGARGPAAFFPSLIFMMSAVYPLHIGTGHPIWFAQAFIPYVFIFLNLSRQKSFHIFWAAGSLALIFFTGNIYYFIFTVLGATLWCLLEALGKNWLPALVKLAVLGLITFIFTAVKLIPMIEMVLAYGKPVSDSSSPGFEVLYKALFSRAQDLRSHQLTGQKWRWWEYGAYIGPLPFVIIIGGLLLNLRRLWKEAIIFIFFLLITLGSGFYFWPLLKSMPLLENLRSPYRMSIYCLLIGGIFGALLLTKIGSYGQKKGNKVIPILLPLLTAFIFVDLLMVNQVSLTRAFTIAPPSPEDKAGQNFIQVRQKKRFKTFYQYSHMYDNFLLNRGSVNCYERLKLPIKAIPAKNWNNRLYKNYRGEYYFSNCNDGSFMAKVDGNEVQQLLFSPNRQIFKVEKLTQPLCLLINQNYHQGWKATIDNSSLEGIKVESKKGLIMAHLPAGSYKLELYYRPLSFIIGLIITIMGLLFIVVYKFLRRKN